MADAKLRFDGWVLDPESGDLERAGTRIRLPEQPALVLRELLAHAGRVVTREQLIALLWPKGVVDFDTGLNTAIRKLRSALGDVAETPRYIETLPRRGYRFIAALEPDAAAAATARLDPGSPAAVMDRLVTAAVLNPVAQREAAPSAATSPSLIPPAVAPSAVIPSAEVIAPVEVPATAGGPGIPRTGTSAAKPTRREHRLLSWAAAAAALISAGLLLRFALEKERAWRDPLAEAQLSRLTDWSGEEQAAAISRDGSWAAFLADRDGPTDVWVTQIGSGNYRNLTAGHVPEVVNPVIRPLTFSPDGSFITVWSRRSDGARPGDITLLRVPTRGGALQPFPIPAAEVSWSSDGTRLVYHTSAPGDPLYVQERSAGAARRIYAAPAGVHCHFPLWSPDDAFIYFARGVPPDAWDIWRIRPNGTGLEQITFQNALVSHPVLLNSRELLYLASDADGSGPWLYATDVERRVPHRISFGLERYTSLAASADGQRLVATVSRPRRSLWSIPLTADSASQGSAVRPVAESVAGSAPRFGPDYLLYVSSQGARLSLWKVSGRVSRELWRREHATLVGGPAVSPDGRRIALTVAEGDRTRLYVMDSDGSHAHLAGESLELRGTAAWTPDGQSLVSAVVRNGEPHLTTIPVLGSAAPLELVSEYSLDPAWSPDGEFVLYSGADIGTTFALRAVTREGRPYGLPALILPRGARRVVFWQHRPAIVVLRGEIGHKNFWLIDLKTGIERQLTALPADFDIRDFDISPDASRLVFDRAEESSEIALIERAR